jgi:hypothetical protein
VPASCCCSHDLETLSHLYAIGIVGAVAINCCSPRLPPAPAQALAQGAMGALGVLLIAIWMTLA